MHKAALQNEEQGSVFIYLLVACFLLAAVMMYYSRGPGTGQTAIAEKGSTKLSQIEQEACLQSIARAREKVQAINNCSDNMVSYETANGEKFNANAPTDKSCHIFSPNGGNIPACGTYLLSSSDPCMALLNVGESCAGVIYAGTASNGKRIYVQPSNTATYLHYDSPTYVATGATSTTDGMGNTNILVALGTRYAAANLCRSLGGPWYLPSQNELITIYTNRNTGSLAGTFSNYQYWSSTETSTHTAYSRNLVDGTVLTFSTKNGGMRVRCVRSD